MYLSYLVSLEKDNDYDHFCQELDHFTFYKEVIA